MGVLAAPSRRPTAALLVFLALGVSTRWQGVSGKVAGCCVSRLGWPAPSCERLAHGSSAVIFEALANVRRCPPAFTKSWPAQIHRKRLSGRAHACLGRADRRIRVEHGGLSS